MGPGLAPPLKTREKNGTEYMSLFQALRADRTLRIMISETGTTGAEPRALLLMLHREVSLQHQ